MDTTIKLYLRNSKTNGISISGETNVYDLLEMAGSSYYSDWVDGAASGERQWGYHARGLCSWISPASTGYTLKSVYFSGWLTEDGNYNQTFRIRIYKYTPGSPAVITELGNSPFSETGELPIYPSLGEYTSTCDVVDTVFNQGDRILFRLYTLALSSGGVEGGSCYLRYNAPDGQQGDSFITITTVGTSSGPEKLGKFLGKDKSTLKTISVTPIEKIKSFDGVL